MALMVLECTFPQLQKIPDSGRSPPLGTCPEGRCYMRDGSGVERMLDRPKSIIIIM